MKIEIAKHERMSESGSSLLRLIQNTNTSKLDLLVRESLQNSLDAGNKQDEYVGVNFRVGEFEAGAFNGYFEGIVDKLNSRYLGKQKYICIKDFNTSGLTGPLHYSMVKNNQFGNLLKLIYEISKAQETQGSGGSWGLGKTVYFRLGIGLVVYYSRIKNENGKFESRLAAALVEDERKSDKLIPEIEGTPQRGIAWWGAAFDENSTIPVTDEEEIEKFLDVLGVKKYTGEKTGTTIIIPFIDEEALLRETFPPSDKESDIPYWSKNGVAEYLKIAVQRWYTPRLDNKKYKGQYLRCSINGNLLEYDNMAPVFQLIQTLYNSDPRNENTFGDKKIYCNSITLRNTFIDNSCAGWISYIKVDSADMKMDNPHNNSSPYYFINKIGFNEVANNPIILYSRKPGMVVSYELTGDWNDGIPKSGKSEFIVGVFKANSNNKIRQNEILLEEYLRQSEKADHMSWCDISNSNFHPNIVTRIQQQVRRKITNDFGEITRGTEEHKNFGLGKTLADLLLPPKDFASWDEGNGGIGGEGGTGGYGENGGEFGGGSQNVKKTKRSILRAIGNPSYNADEVTQNIQICFGKQTKVKIASFVITENNSLSSSRWEAADYLDKKFPIEVLSIKLRRIYITGKPKTSQMLKSAFMLNHDNKIAGLDFKFMNTCRFNVQYGLEITAPDDSGYVVEGVISYRLDNVRGALNLEND